MGSPLLPALPGYEDVELIAHGTTALVFRAIQTRLARPVAIKVITVDTGSTPVNAARELATTVALSSQPHIVSIIDTGTTDDDRPYIVMEYCEGGSYAQILRQHGPLPVRDVIEVGVNIGEALHAAHQVGIVHRDVKPSNILRSRFGPALTDFGIARAPDELSGTLTREMMTPHHASPEALLHQAQSGLSDVYSLASTLWTLLVGHPPFVEPGQGTLDIYAFRDRVLHDDPPPMARPDVPAWLLIELTQAMAKLPVQRHASAAEFAEALRRGAMGLGRSPAAATPPGVARARPVRVTPAWSTPPRPIDPAPVRASATPTRPPAAPPPAPPEAPTPDRDAPPRYVAPMDEEGGWLADVTPAGPGPDEPDRGGQPAAPYPRRFDDDGRGGRRRWPALVAGLVAMAVAAVALAAVLALNPGRRDPGAAPTPTTPGPAVLSTAAPGAPVDLRLDDTGTAVTIRWTDPSGGTVPFVVTGRTAEGQTLGLREVGPAVTSVRYDQLDPDREYCFLVTAVYSGTHIAPSGWACTRR